MGNEFGSVYLGQLIAVQALNEARFGKRKSKKSSFMKRMMKKVTK